MADKGKILAVDDNLASLKLLTNLLKEEGYEACSATNGEIALRAVRANPPELVLLDIRMPEMDGFEVCRRLKGQPETQNIPVLFVSALSETVPTTNSGHFKKRVFLENARYLHEHKSHRSESQLLCEVGFFNTVIHST